MSTGFGTENICWVPEGELFRFIDLTRWAEWRLDLDHWRVALPASARTTLIRETEEGLARCRARGEGDAELLQAVDRAERLCRALEEVIESLSEELAMIAYPAGSLDALWVRVSDLPLESFHADDYRPPPEPTESLAHLPAIGALALPDCESLEIPLLDQTGDNFSLLTPGFDCVAEYPLPLDQMLPIFDEFCGQGGNSNRGKMVNLSLDGRLTGETPVCVPLHRLPGDLGFVTLYMLFQAPQEHAVALPLRSRQVHRVEASLEGQGFTCVLAHGRNQIWRRADDWIHCVWNAPGLESADVSTLPPFVIAAQAEGSRDPALREALLAAVLQTAIGKVPDSRG